MCAPLNRSMSEATFPLSIVFALQGIAAALGGKWALDVSGKCPLGQHVPDRSCTRFGSPPLLPPFPVCERLFPCPWLLMITSGLIALEEH